MTELDGPLSKQYRYRGHLFTGPADTPVALLPIAVGGGVLLLLLVAVLLYQVANLGRVYPGVMVLGVDLSGTLPEEAVARMEQQITTYSNRPIVLRYGATEWRVTPGDLGLRFDPRSAVGAAYAVGREGSIVERTIVRIRAGLFGEQIDNLGLLLDEQQASTFIAGLAQQVDRPVVDANLTITPDGNVSLTPSQTGRQLDRQALIAQLGPVLLSQSDAPIDLPVVEVPPAVTEASFANAHEQAQAILRDPLVLTAAEVTRTLTVADLASLLSVHVEGTGNQQKASLLIDEGKLQAILDEVGKEVQSEPVNARFQRLSNGQLEVIRESKPGQQIDVPAAIELIKQKAASSERTLALPVTVVEPAVRSEDATVLSFPDLIDENYTSYAGSLPDRAHNVELATGRLNGVVVMPGQMFSFNQELGPTTLSTGYRWGYGITRTESGIETIPSVAGGICQVATTLFQSVFFSGYQIEERNWHLYWIPSYGKSPRGMIGLDATVDDPVLDFKFLNTTEHPLLIEAKAERNQVTFRLYGTKPNWTVKIEEPKITNVRKANQGVVREVDASLPPGREIWVETAQDGFDVEIVRTVTHGDEVRTLRMRSTYEPSRNVILVGPNTPTQEATVTTASEASSAINRPAGGETVNEQPGDAQEPAQSTPAATQPAGAAPQATPAATQQSAAGSQSTPAATQPAEPTPAAAATQAPTAAQPAQSPAATTAAASPAAKPQPSPAAKPED